MNAGSNGDYRRRRSRLTGEADRDLPSENGACIRRARLRIHPDAWLALVAVAVVGCVVSGPMLIAWERPVASDMIVVIGGDHKPERVWYGVELHKRGYAPVVVLSGGTVVYEGDIWMTEAEMMRRYALRFGLPAEVMIVEALSSSTLENARQTQTICEERGCRSILLVTSPYQSRRARRVFRDVLGPQVRVVAQPALQGALKLHWWRYPDHVLVVVYEYQHRVRDWVQGAVSVVRDGADRGAGQRDPCHSGLTVLECLFDPR